MRHLVKGAFGNTEKVGGFFKVQDFLCCIADVLQLVDSLLKGGNLALMFKIHLGLFVFCHRLLFYGFTC